VQRVNFDPAVIALWILPFLAAVVFHEWAHGAVAKRLGDDTASVAGRLTLNPLAHVDPVGTIALPAFLLITGSPFMFGWAKPVPVSFERLNNPRRDMILVAIAGPLMNLLLAAVSVIGLVVIGHLAQQPTESSTGGLRIAEPLAYMCQLSLQLNIVLAVFNMLPIPPLDGGRVAVGLLPYEMAENVAQLEPYGFFIILALLATGALDFILGPLTRGILHVLLAIFT
jgi:Zn-dependent protease